MKLKTGLTFSAISALFSVDTSAVSRIFTQILHHVVSATENFIFWSARSLVQDTMPQCFRAKYGNTRLIMDCTEFRIEIPSKLDDRVWCYSHYKHGFIIKLLVGITPGVYVCFKSKAADGRQSDSQLTIESGLLDLLEEGDLVLADWGFPEIKTAFDPSGKKVLVEMPPFFSDEKEFSKEETQETYNTTSVRIHV
ncbi:hypothetical protein QAD02_006814 [Eretmocerus hayati]|uniref:Uncharacterized protein n=1 Tax=Eretmocerus hayati TaxID=131215 RepID=A0ACC2N299_9HYME|nr:hypothetical protein QAD02_006814 [Eretmocerus hayati]